MLPSSTVENYLKAIALQQHAVGDALVPMGQIASALGVTPGTATTMVKALAESGLVQYEPYSGVRLTGAGEKLAGLVLRRHRLVELFLVEVMGLRWDEVHEEAEKLEHVVSERLIERMDEMLGRPEVDPHGDPIPDADGAIRERELHTLLDCPLDTPVTITRVTDQGAPFLRFIESSHLKPGETIQVESRDAVADSVRVRGRDEQRTTIGTRAASKLLVEVLPVLMYALLALAAPAGAQEAPAAARDGSRPFEILDNSFFVEEAFNQEARIFQNIFGFVRTSGGEWAGAFTQEWPAPNLRHQLSYTLAFSRERHSADFDDVALTYRYQLLPGENGGTAMAPRVSLLLRTDGEESADYGKVGWQLNLPVSRQIRDIFLHGNIGATIYPGVAAALSTAPPADVTLFSPFVAGSIILRARPMLHLMLESVLQFDDAVTGPGASSRTRAVTISPGARFGWNIGPQQVILGVAVPVVRSEGDADAGVFTYASWELPFMR